MYALASALAATMLALYALASDVLANPEERLTENQTGSGPESVAGKRLACRRPVGPSPRLANECAPQSSVRGD
jgi:hypothetical protein